MLRCSRWGLYAVVAGLPLYVVRWHYGPLPTTLLETLIVVTVALHVAARWREGMRRPAATPYDIPVVVLLVAGAVSVAVAQDHRGALGLYRAYFVEPIAIFYVAVDLLRGGEHMLRAAAAFALGSSTFAAINLVVFARALAAHAVNVGAAPNAFYGDANYVAMYMEPPVAMAVGFLVFGRSRRERLFGAAWLAVTGAALAVMFSKGSWLALFVLVGVVILTAPRWRLYVAGALVAAAAVATQIPLVMARLATVPPSINGRQAIFGAGLGAIRAHPILGLGLGGFSYRFRGVSPEIHPHDMWLTFWVETGVAGVIAFAVVLFGLLWRGWRAWPSFDGPLRPLLWGVLGALVMWTVHGLVDSPYWKNDMSAEFWTLAALEICALRAARRSA